MRITAVALAFVACGPERPADPSFEACIVAVECSGVPNDTETPGEFCSRTERDISFLGECPVEGDALAGCHIREGACEGDTFVVGDRCGEEQTAYDECLVENA